MPPRLLLLLDEGHEELPRDLDGEARDEGRVGQDDREEDLARLRLRVVHLAREQRRRVSGGRRQRERDKSQTDRQIDVTLNLQSSLNLTRGLGWSGWSPLSTMVRRRHSDHTMILPIKLEPSEQAEERDSPASIREPAGEAHAHARTRKQSRRNYRFSFPPKLEMPSTSF